MSINDSAIVPIKLSAEVWQVVVLVVCPRRVSSFCNQVLFTVGDVWCVIGISLTLATDSRLVRLRGTTPWDLAWSFPSPR